jgi:hypothetical protein
MQEKLQRSSVPRGLTADRCVVGSIPAAHTPRTKMAAPHFALQAARRQCSRWLTSTAATPLVEHLCLSSRRRCRRERVPLPAT